ncbi:MAG: hypothetical protein KC457_00855 [Myxococcales bacterium]|nr:hypothetical protein [Myxococcales bacterium]
MTIGLWQQLSGLSADQTDCEYRTELMRERLMALMDRPISTSWRSEPGRVDLEAHDDFANLLRETHAACDDASPELAQKLDRIDEIFDRDRERRKDAAAARAELSALQGSSR